MRADQLLWNPRFTRALVRERRFAGHELVLVDIGMEDGIPLEWTHFRDQLQVYGFPRDPARCADLNAAATEWRQRCYPDRLAGSQTVAGAKPIGFAALAQTHGLPRPDFMRVYADGDEPEVLRGAQPFLNSDGLLGLELSLSFLPTSTGSPFLSAYETLAQSGYFLYTLAPYRYARRALPMPLAADHRDRHGNPIAAGPVGTGQISRAEVVFFRDWIADEYVPPADDPNALIRLLKAAALFEIYNLPDCAAELLLYYRQAFQSILPVDEWLNRLVPIVRGRSFDYAEYLNFYKERSGRL